MEVRAVAKNATAHTKEQFAESADCRDELAGASGGLAGRAGGTQASEHPRIPRVFVRKSGSFDEVEKNLFE